MKQNENRDRTDRIGKVFNASNKKAFFTNIITALFLNVFLEYMERKSMAEVLHFINERTFVFLYNFLILFICLSIVFLVKKKLFVWASVTGAWIMVGLCNGFILESRKTPFTAVDIMLTKSILPIINSYLKIWQIAGLVILLIVLVNLMVWLCLYSPVAKKSFDLRVNMSLFILQMIIFGAITYVAVGRGMLISSFDNLIAGYKDYGVAYGFCVTALDTGIDRPIDYSYQKMRNLNKKINKAAAKLEKTEQKEKHQPNIIFVQLESFFDLSTVKKLKLSRDPIPYFHRLQAESTSGYLKVPVYGAGTINTEFEVITGMSTKFFGTGEYPYRSILQDHTCDSIAYWLEGQPYEKTVIHNNNAAFYDRNHVLSNLGFDNFITIENMNATGTNEAGWAKDEVLTGEILETLSATQDNDLIYTISVQGHGDYPTDPLPDAPIQVTGEGMEESYLNQLTYYANQTAEMDLFIKKLTDKLSNYPEETIVIFYGDHLPGMDFKDQDLTSESKYKTPYLIWDNYGYNKENKKKESGNVTAYQLASKVFAQIGSLDGIINRFHQTMRQTKNYRANLKLIQYDMLYDSDFISKENNIIRQPTTSNFCLRPISVFKVKNESSGTCIYGKNFTEDSRVFINGRKVKSRFHSRYMLKIGSGRLHNLDEIVIHQVSRTNENITLNESGKFIYYQSVHGESLARDEEVRDDSR